MPAIYGMDVSLSVDSSAVVPVVQSVVGIVVVESVFEADFKGYILARYPVPNDICCGPKRAVGPRRRALSGRPGITTGEAPTGVRPLRKIIGAVPLISGLEK